MIPKILHYCWFGNKPIPDKFQKFIDGWHQKMPEYQIIVWNETNSPMQLKYMKSAYANRKWANLSNYTRLHVLKEMGGIYLDTDIEVIKSFDPLLNNRAFLGFESSANHPSLDVNNAVFGSVAGHPFVERLMNAVLEKFDGTEYAHLSSPAITTQLLKESGLAHYGNQIVADVALFEMSYFYPYTWNEEFTPDCIRPETFTVHHWEKSWETQSTSNKRVTLMDRIAFRMRRLLKK